MSGHRHDDLEAELGRVRRRANKTADQLDDALARIEELERRWGAQLELFNKFQQQLRALGDMAQVDHDRVDEQQDQLSTLATAVAGVVAGDVDVDDYMAAHDRWAAPRQGGQPV